MPEAKRVDELSPSFTRCLMDGMGGLASLKNRGSAESFAGEDIVSLDAESPS